MKHAPASFLGLDRQLSALIVVKAQPLVSQLFTQDPVPFLKIVDDILLPLVQPACKGNQKQAKGIKCRAHYAPANTARTGQGCAKLATSHSCNGFCFEGNRVFGHYDVVECKGCQTTKGVAINRIRRGLEQV